MLVGASTIGDQIGFGRGHNQCDHMTRSDEATRSYRDGEVAPAGKKRLSRMLDVIPADGGARRRSI